MLWWGGVGWVADTRFCVPHLASILMWVTKGWFECQINAPGVCCVNILPWYNTPIPLSYLTMYCTSVKCVVVVGGEVLMAVVQGGGG